MKAKNPGNHKNYNYIEFTPEIYFPFIFTDYYKHTQSNE